jgi:hypothetical protein
MQKQLALELRGAAEWCVTLGRLLRLSVPPFVQPGFWRFSSQGVQTGIAWGENERFLLCSPSLI